MPCQGQTTGDSAMRKESFILSLFPDDCMAIYHLSFNSLLKSKLDSIRSKINIYSITVRKKSGLANIVFEKLAESLLPDSLKYVLFRVDFKYEGKNTPYLLQAEGSMNCDTLKSIITVPIIHTVSESVLVPGLASKTFDQPIVSGSTQLFNSAIFPAVDTLISLFNEDRTQNLASEIDKYLIQTEDSLSKRRALLKFNFAYARERLVEFIASENSDSSIYFGNRSQYANEGMSDFFVNSFDSTQSTELNNVDVQLDNMLKFDKQLLCIRQLTDNIDYIRKNALYLLSLRIKTEIEKISLDVDEFLANKNKAMIYLMVKNYFLKYTLQHLKEILTDKS